MAEAGVAFPGVAELGIAVEVLCKKHCQSESATVSAGPVQIYVPVMNQAEG